MRSASSLGKSAFFQPYTQKCLSCRVRRVIWNRRSQKTRARSFDAVELPESLWSTGSTGQSARSNAGCRRVEPLSEEFDRICRLCNRQLSERLRKNLAIPCA